LIGMGKGTLPVEVDAEKRITAQFNASHDIQIEMEVVEGGQAGDTLRREIELGAAPDIVGPMDLRAASEMGDIWLDISRLIQAQQYDLSGFIGGSTEYFQLDDPEGVFSLPFAVDPSILYFNKSLFDAEGMNYPPDAYGEKYRWKNEDGSISEMDWSVNTLREIALRLTKDARGKHPLEAGFDKEHIVQFGFASQLGDLREQAALFGTGSFLSPDGKSATIPAMWRTGLRWYYDGLWNDVFMPIADYLGTDALNMGDPFNSGRVAMTQARLQYTCCLGTDLSWDIAPVPSHRGGITAVLQAESYFILSSTKHPEEALEVLEYLVGDAAPNLLAVYGQMPARKDAQESFWNPLKKKYPSVQHWHVAVESVMYADVPSCILAMPANRRAEERIAAFQTELLTLSNLDIDRSLDELRGDLQKIFSAAP
jgi:multiple sugar transport system substrate-binding protein